MGGEVEEEEARQAAAARVGEGLESPEGEGSAKRVAAAGSGWSRGGVWVGFGWGMGGVCAAPPKCRVGGRQAVVCLDEARIKLQALLRVLHGGERHAQLEVGSRPVAEELDLGTGAATTQAM